MAGSTRALPRNNAGFLRWSGRLQTLRAMALIAQAQLLIRFVPLDKWHRSLGRVIKPVAGKNEAGAGDSWAKAQAARVKRAATRFPVEPKCLAQAMALQWLLVKGNASSRLVIAMKGEGAKEPDGFHAWVELDGEMLIGECDSSQYRTLMTFGR